MIETIQSLLRSIEEAEAVYYSGMAWNVKYSLMFQQYRAEIKPGLKSLGLSLDWCDPDTSYKADVQAYWFALDGLRNELEKIANGR